MYDGPNRPFRFWCQKVLPLVYDESLSYYELLCKVVDYLNKIVAGDKEMAETIQQLQEELQKLQQWQDQFDPSFIEATIKSILEKYIATMIFVEINQQGYIVYNIPERWSDITFNTTGLDIILAMEPEYGHLVLSY